MVDVAGLIQRHLPNLLTAEYFRTAIYFHRGGLDLHPREIR
jgi:hypothetical protein